MEVSMFLLDDVNELYNNFYDKVKEENNLSKKTKLLIGLACSVMADCSPCIEWYYKNAIETGASKEEIAEAFAISMAVCAGSKRAKYSELISDLEQGGK
jgi:AhpD family alkylhydroperoxidase